jgi:hypothetical protein
MFQVQGRKYDKSELKDLYIVFHLAHKVIFQEKNGKSKPVRVSSKFLPFLRKE